MEERLLNNLFKPILIILTFLIVGSQGKVIAADLNVNCSSNDCVMTSGSLFNEANIAPGFYVEKTILVDNTGNNDNCNLTLLVTRQGGISDPDLASKLLTSISSNSISYYGDRNNINARNMAGLFGNNISLGVVNANSTRQYNWNAQFDIESGNDYQSKGLAFNFGLNFSCGNVNPINNIQSIQPLSNALILGVDTDNLDENQNYLQIENILSKSSILGLECENNINWWIIPSIQSLLTLLIILVQLLKVSSNRFLLFPILFGILSQGIHNYYGCGCNNEYLCTHYIYLNLAITLIGLLSSYFIIRSRTQKPQ